MELTPRQQRALEAICDTFAPGGDGWPSAAELGISRAMVKAIAGNPREAERRQFLQLLSLWDFRVHSVLAGARPSGFSDLPLEARCAVLLSWCDSAIPRRRAAFQALRKAVAHYYTSLAGPGGSRSAVWDKLRYPGPLGHARRGGQGGIRPLRAEPGETLKCDVCVVGSGAGGGTAAGVLAAAGLDVIVLEAGGFYDDADFDGDQHGGFERLYWQGGAAATVDQSAGLLAGTCLGGGTIINYTTSFRTPDDVRAEWAAAGVPWFASQEYTRSLDAVCARLSVNLDHNRVSAREQVFERGLRALEWHVAAMPRNVIGCDQGRICGYCGFGCSLGAKQSTAKTWLADAAAAGARIFIEARAEKILIERGSACGVVGYPAGADNPFTVRARAVVVAGGAIQSPGLLLRSGLENPHLGRHLHLHPVTVVWGEMDEEVRPWEGTLQAVYSDQHRHLDGNFGVKYETTAFHPCLVAGSLPWRDPIQHRELLALLPRLAGIGILLRDRDGGRVSLDSQGDPVVRYSLSSFDREHMRTGLSGAAQILEAAGARRIFSSHAKWVAYEPGRAGNVQTFLRDADACGWSAGRCVYFSLHIMGTARLGGSPQTSATNPDGETWEARNLFVMDGSSFPSASGVNPMISIEAIAHRNASALAARLA
jgi:long-chain-alcohol oxidase